METIDTRVVARLPDSLRRRAAFDGGAGERDSFLEGPAFDRRGVFHCTDLHNGRILRVRDGRVEVVSDYGGVPNGLKVHADGRLVVACHRRGIAAVDPRTGEVTTLVDRYRGEPFRAPNDLVFARNGDLYFTDPGEADLRDPHGRLFRLRAGGDLELLLGDTVARIRSAAGLGTSNVAFGGPDRRSLWITEAEAGVVLEARMPAAGLALCGQR
ncbi:MAG TPA: SMP-30/gluconolactonase/LRE family protein [Thermodesulfobacteriota bacterium]